MIEFYVLFRAFTYFAVAMIALNRRCYPIAVLMGLLVGAALHPEIINSNLFGEFLLATFPIVSLWVGWHISRSKNH